MHLCDGAVKKDNRLTAPRRYATFIIFVVLASLDNAAAGVLPPLYAIISRDLNASEASLGWVTAVYFVIVAIAAIYWGFRGDQSARKPLLFGSTIIWATAMILTATAQTFTLFLIFQLITAVGVGGISSIGFSIVSDFVPAHRRGFALSLWSVSQGIGAAFGSLAASTLGAVDWRYPFFLIAGLGFLFGILYLFTKEPFRGQAEPELATLFAAGIQYEQRIILADLPLVLKRPSIRWLLLQSFFFSLAYGSTIWIPRWAIARVQAEGHSLEIATVVGNLFVALFSLGGFFSIYAGHLGDKLQRHALKKRPLLAAAGLLSSIPFFIMLYFLPLRGVVVPEDGELWGLITAVAFSLFTNPWVIAAFIIAFLAIALQSTDPPNWAAMITDLTLPEHRGTIIGLSRLMRAGANAISIGLAGSVIAWISPAYSEPINYAIGLTLFQILVIPAGICYIGVMRSIQKDRYIIKQTLTARATQ
ncbi:MAG: MFS transporter [Chloroflexi bacterium]|nr:MFS transporter [Chloroflexota bacterium]